MAIKEISPEAFEQSESGSRFMLLGDPKRESSIRDFIRRKIRRQTRERSDGIWGTLGKADDDHRVSWSGRLSYSASGNDNSKGLTLQEIRDLYDINPALHGGRYRVIERYINFDEVTFHELPESFTEDELPRLRLTLFVQPDEGAMLFYQHTTRNWKNEGNGDLEYILPEPTQNHGTDRDRLDYYFPILPNRKIERIPESAGQTSDLQSQRLKLGEALPTSFVIKILVFKRDDSQDTASKIMNTAFRLAGGEDKYQLLKFQPDANAFEPVDRFPGTNGRTLLLLHGTFSSTDGSFSGLIKSDYAQGSWLQNMHGRYYDQIIGFNHLTIPHDVDQNGSVLRDLISNDARNPIPADIITFSRGGLLGKYLITSPLFPMIHIRKAALVTCANGVGYFHRGERYLGRFFRYMKVAGGGPAARIITGLAQLSADFFMSLPGPRMMNQTSNRLQSLLAASPAEWNRDIRMKAFTGRWHRSIHSEARLARRLLQRGLHTLTIPFLGTPNDLVVNKKRQAIMPPGYGDPPVAYRCTHTSYFKSRLTSQPIRDDLETFLR